MTEDPVSSDQSRNWKTHVTVALCGMKQASSTWGTVGRSESSGRNTGNYIRHSLYVCVVLYQAGQHPLFLCEWIGCTTRHNKHSMTLRRRVNHKSLLGRWVGSAHDSIYDIYICLILKTMFIKIHVIKLTVTYQFLQQDSYTCINIGTYLNLLSPEFYI
jgi:hypothetical protein